MSQALAKPEHVAEEPARASSSDGQRAPLPGAYLQATLAVSFGENLRAEPAVLASTIAAWDKLLTVRVDMILATFDALEAHEHWY